MSHVLYLYYSMNNMNIRISYSYLYSTNMNNYSFIRIRITALGPLDCTWPKTTGLWFGRHFVVWEYVLYMWGKSLLRRVISVSSAKIQPRPSHVF